MNRKYSPNDQSAAGSRTELSRRIFLRGVGVSLALPTLESLIPRALAAAPAGGQPALAATASGAPLRMAYVYVPNGVNQVHWWPKTAGKDFELTRTLQPLEKVKHQIQLLGGLDQVNAYGGLDGPGDHARASGTFLTGVRVKKTAGADIHAGVSVDQVAAQRVGHLTRFPSLELTCDSVRKSGNLRFRLFLRLPVQPVVEQSHGPRVARAQSAARFSSASSAPARRRATQESRAATYAATLDPRFRPRRYPALGAN